MARIVAPHPGVGGLAPHRDHLLDVALGTEDERAHQTDDQRRRVGSVVDGGQFGIRRGQPPLQPVPLVLILGRAGRHDGEQLRRLDPGALRRVRALGPVEGELGPHRQIGVVTRHVPEPAEIVHQRKGLRAGSGVAEEPKRRQHVVPLGDELRQGGQLSLRTQLRIELMSQRCEVLGMRLAGVTEFVALVQPLHAVLPDGLQHPVATAAAGRIREQRLVDQRQRAGRGCRRRGSASNPHTATAASTVAPAGNTARRSASSRSGGSSRSQLHSTTARSVR